MKYFISLICLLLITINGYSQKLKLGEYYAIKIGFYENNKLVKEDYNFKDQKLDVRLSLLQHTALVNLYGNTFNLSNYSSLEKKYTPHKHYQASYSMGERLIFYERRENNEWFTEVIYLPEKQNDKDYIHLIFFGKLITSR